MTLIAAFAVALVSAQAAAPESLTVISWGGAYTRSQVEAYMKPTTFENLLNAVQNGFQWWSDNQARMDSRFTRRGWPETEPVLARAFANRHHPPDLRHRARSDGRISPFLIR